MREKVAILMGGWSAEREISLISGAAVSNSLEQAGYEVTTIDMQRDMRSLLAQLLPKADVVHIDAGHSHQEVLYDIQRCIEQLGNPILIFDDVCKKLFPNGEIGNTIRTAVDQHVEDGKLNIVKYIGEDKGYTTGNGKVLLGREGMICNVQLRRI